jgi:hypothetical protein
MYLHAEEGGPSENQCEGDLDLLAHPGIDTEGKSLMQN